MPSEPNCQCRSHLMLSFLRKLELCCSSHSFQFPCAWNLSAKGLLMQERVPNLRISRRVSATIHVVKQYIPSFSILSNEHAELVSRVATLPECRKPHGVRECSSMVAGRGMNLFVLDTILRRRAHILWPRSQEMTILHSCSEHKLIPCRACQCGGFCSDAPYTRTYGYLHLPHTFETLICDRCEQASGKSDNHDRANRLTLICCTLSKICSMHEIVNPVQRRLVPSRPRKQPDVHHLSTTTQTVRS